MHKCRALGFTLVEIMIVVAIIGLLSVIALPSFMRARSESMKQVCIEQLRQVASAKDQYILGHNGSLPGDMNDLVPEMNKRVPSCPAGGTYSLGGLTEDPSCSQSALGHTI